ncbi:hypothetical protein QAD02_005655 [Eretmocerus hayati]|uniref:Uncharacterized protein n=1 Tax=Eretmocerus hayati TaxID=131215 RepID=A0ACC2NT43_9HYME|nr:hypothetical protein QAD02_005655 [Eretmocerus hayati]
MAAQSAENPLPRLTPSNEKNDPLFNAISEAICGSVRVENSKDNFHIQIKQLLEAGADLRVQDSSGKTILHHLAIRWIEGSKKFIHRQKQHQTANNESLHGKVRDYIAKFVIPKSNVNQCDKLGRTSLHYAALERNVEMVRMLLSAGARPNLADKEENTPLLLATQCRSRENFSDVAEKLSEVFDKIIGEVRINSAEPEVGEKKNGDAPILDQACTPWQLRDKELIDLLLTHGASLTTVDRNGLNALLHAVQNDKIPIVKQLLEAGADINFVNVKVVKRDPSTPMTALHLAIMKHDLDMLEYLLRHGADPNQTNELGRSILSCAAEVSPSKNMLPRLELLLLHGADLYAAGSNYSKSPFQLLMSKGRVAEVRLFLQHGLDLDRYSPQRPSDFSPVHCAVSCKRGCDMLSLLLKFDTKNRLRLDHVDQDGCSPLNHITRCMSFEHHKSPTKMMEALIEFGADVNTVDNMNHSPLENLVLSSRSRCQWKEESEKQVQLLVTAGAKVRNVLHKLLREANVDKHSRYNYLRLRYIQCIIKYKVLYESHQKTVVEPLIGNQISKTEIILLKNSPLHESSHQSITCYDVLVDKKIYERVRDDQVYAELDKNHLQDRFPLYGQYLIECFERIRIMHKVWEEAVKKLSKYLGYDNDAYYLIIRNILKRLRNAELRSVAES